MANISKRNRRRERELRNAAKNRREIIAARLSRRDMIRAGLLTSAGYLIQKNGLSARAQFSGDCDNRWRDGSGGNGTPVSPPTTPFVEPLPIPPIAQSVPSLSPAPTVVPNIAAGEGRTRNHQALTTLPPVKFYEVHQREALISMHPDYPLQRLWTFNGTVPGQTYVARYGEPILVRNFNDLPNDNGGFGIQSVSTHLHNGHTPSESDGFPCDFFGQGKFYDQHYPNVLAGFASSHPPTGDIRESMSTLIKDKIVVINFMYVKCEGICMPITTNLKRVQKLLGDRIGRDISMYSITLKPEEDTPAKLKQYVKAHHIKPGWTFLTGKPDEITTLRRSLGFKDAKQKLDQDLTNHTGMVKYGNEPRLWWAMFPGKANAPWIAECIQWMYGPNGNPIPRAELDKAMGTEPGHKHAKT